jgi:hypothetical protein
MVGGYNAGAGIAAFEQERLAKQQAMQLAAMKQQQETMLQQQRQAAFARLNAPDVTPNDYRNAALLGNKEQSEVIMKMMAQNDEATNRATISKLAPTVFALHANKPERAISALEQQLQAYQDNPAAQQQIQSQIDAIKTDPESAKLELTGVLSLVPGGEKVLENVLSLTKESREAAEASRTKLAPSIQEALDFKNLPPEDQKAFLSLQSLKRPPAAVTNVNVTNLEKSAASQLGELVPKLYEQANSAAAQLDQLPRYRRALDSAITGPMADQRLTAARIGSALGFTGDKAVSATTELIQGFAEMALQSRGMLTGQGAVSNEEQKLLVRARSGDINFTKSELNTLLNVSDRAARAQYSKSRKLLESAATKSETAGMFLQNVPSISETQPEQPQGKTGVTVTLPNGRSFVFPNQQAADQFKARAGVL